MDLPFPEDVNNWGWETILEFAEQDESQYLEFKQTIHPPEGPKESDKIWQKKLEREIVAFANASGGYLVFGVNDEGKPAPFKPPDHELKQSVTRLIQNTRPPVDLDISPPITPPSNDTNRIILAIRIYEATRKPVLTSDSAIYWRINDRKEPMSLDQIEKLIVERDRRQQAIRQLEMEIERFNDLLQEEGSKKLTDRSDKPPNYHLINTESLKQVLQENTHLYSDERNRELINKAFRRLREIEDQEVYYGRAVNGVIEPPGGPRSFSRVSREKLKEELDWLKEILDELSESAGLDADT